MFVIHLFDTFLQQLSFFSLYHNMSVQYEGTVHEWSGFQREKDIPLQFTTFLDILNTCKECGHAYIMCGLPALRFECFLRHFANRFY